MQANRDTSHITHNNIQLKQEIALKKRRYENNTNTKISTQVKISNQYLKEERIKKYLNNYKSYIVLIQRWKAKSKTSF